MFLPVAKTCRAAASGLLALLAPVAVAAQSRPALGPADGIGLPAVDTARVKPGTLAPDFTLEALDGRRITLSEYRGKKNVILVFYRGWW